jgi:hypothetical protein
MDVATGVEPLLCYTQKSDQMIDTGFPSGLISDLEKGVKSKVLNDPEEECADSNPEGKTDPINQSQ